jgi:hypothetical protein
MNFITSAANLRAFVYNLKGKYCLRGSKLKDVSTETRLYEDRTLETWLG